MLDCHQYDVCENHVGSVYIGEFCPVSFGECPSVLLLSVVMSFVDCGDDG